MWEVIRFLSQAKHPLESTKAEGEVRTVWASFVKTRNARMKSAHVSLVRRVTIALTLDARTENGGIKNVLNTQFSAYDCDWNLGTIWCGSLKLGSATHKAPKDGEHIIMPGGWVSLDSVAETAGCSIDEAKLAFEREL